MSDTLDKPSNQEDAYFAREDIEKMRVLHRQQVAARKEEERAALKALHYMHCPKCGLELHTLERGAVTLDTCFNCHGVWLDAGELEQVIAESQTGGAPVMKAVLNLFRGK